IASITFTPPGCEQRRSIFSRAMPSLAHISSTVCARCSSMKGGIARSNTTASPGSSTSQPMMRCVSGKSFSAEPVIRARLCSPAVTTAAAAPSPNRAVATTAAGSSLSSRIEIEQVSTVTNSQFVPGSAAAIVPQAHAGTDTRFEARRCDAGCGDGDHAVDLVGLETGLFDRGAARLDEHALRGFQIKRVTVTPAVAGHVPILRSDDVAASDASIVKDARKPVEQRLFAAKCFAGSCFGFVLFDYLRWNRGRQ